MSSAPPFTCSECPGSKFTIRKNLLRHRRKQHGEENARGKKPSVICNKCGNSFFFHDQLIEHLNVEHFFGLSIKSEKPMSLKGKFCC